MIIQLIGKGLLYFLSLGVAGYALYAYCFFPLGSLVHPGLRESLLAHPVGIYCHVFSSVVALLLGPFQFSGRLRKRYPDAHRWSGRFYLAVGVLAGGLSGLYMSRYAFGGSAARLGFALLSIFWLFTGVRAYLAVRCGDIDDHHRWMIRNFSLTFAAVMLRIYVPASFLFGIEFEKAYAVIAWACWIPNLIFVEWRYNHRQ